MPAHFYIGTAGWSIPAPLRPLVPEIGSGLARYAGRLPAVEINSSFYRPHRPATYARWAASVPPEFRFSVKLPKVITHERRLIDAADPLARFLGEVSALGGKLGCLLIQLPPSLDLEVASVDGFLRDFRRRYPGPAVIEPRHSSWFSPRGDQLLVKYRISRVAADPALSDRAHEPGGYGNPVYYRLHGSPKQYHSAYDSAYLRALAARMAVHRGGGRDAWCMFDNTASGAAAANALELLADPAVT
ncbi:MAG: DUF72 domain-containing protein [Gemmatimonadota bacterium]